MADREVVVRRLRELDRRLGELRRLRATGNAEAYRHELPLQAQVERHLQSALQAVIDVASHLAAQESARTPEDYGDTFVVLADEGLITASLGERLRRAAGMRNVLVHGYAEIDHDIVWESLDQLEDLREFAAAVVAHLEIS